MRFKIKHTLLSVKTTLNKNKQDSNHSNTNCISNTSNNNSDTILITNSIQFHENLINSNNILYTKNNKLNIQFVGLC